MRIKGVWSLSVWSNTPWYNGPRFSYRKNDTDAIRDWTITLFGIVIALEQD